MSKPFLLRAPFEPTGDQPKAIAEIVGGIREGLKEQVLMGVTGSGKTNVMAWAIEQLARPVLILSLNKTLAAQLWAEFRRLFPENAVEYFVSYYDYYQPEAYIARSDTYIEKDSSRNEEIDRLRHSTTQALITRRDVIVVASVSCIYGIGSPEDYMGEALEIGKGESIRREMFLRKLTEMQYERNDYDLGRLRFRVRGDVVDLVPAYEEKVYRVEFFGDDVDRILELDGTTGEILGSREDLKIFPATHYVTPAQKMELALRDIENELDERVKWFEEHGRLLEAHRAGRPDHRGTADRGPGRRPARGVAKAHRGRSPVAGDDADEAFRRGPRRLHEGDGSQGQLHPLRHRHPGADRDPPRPPARDV